MIKNEFSDQVLIKHGFNIDLHDHGIFMHDGEWEFDCGKWIIHGLHDDKEACLIIETLKDIPNGDYLFDTEWSDFVIEYF